MVEMKLVGVRVELPSNTPMVVLREAEGDRPRVLPIFIGGPEATAVALALDEVVTPRPMTHDLMKDVLDELGVELSKVVITELRGGTFYAELHLEGPAGPRTVSSRPSDAIALAVRTGSPIFADEDVVAEAAQPVDDGDQSEQVVEEFKEFIDRVSPEDFVAPEDPGSS